MRVLVMHCLDYTLLPLKSLAMVLVQQFVTGQLAALSHALLSDSCAFFSRYLTIVAVLDEYCFNMFKIY